MGNDLLFEVTENAVVRGDGLLLRQALANIVHNAIKYTPRGGSIVIGIRSNASHAFLDVIDSGPGIPAQHLSKVFDRFYRVEEGRSRESGGTGLGLSIARWAVESHMGHIAVESYEGGGCTFTIMLPRAGMPNSSDNALLQKQRSSTASIASQGALMTD